MPLSGGRTWAAWYIIHSTSDFGLARLPPRQTPIKCVALFSKTSLLGQPILEYCLDRPPVPPPVLFEKVRILLETAAGRAWKWSWWDVRRTWSLRSPELHRAFKTKFCKRFYMSQHFSRFLPERDPIKF